jgi:pimeloyl-ACP methyl ester carboxylesterase
MVGTRSDRTRTATSVVVNVDNKYESPIHRPRLSSMCEDDIEDIPCVSASRVKPIPETGNPIVQNLAIFMFHGVGGSSDVWQAQIDYLKHQGYELVVPDFLGHGFSSAPRESKAYLFSRLANDILFIFDKYCKKSNVIIGHSYG